MPNRTIRLKRLFFSILFITTFLCGRSQTFSPDQIKADMAFLKKKFEKIHPGMYYYLPKENYTKIYDSLYKATTKDMSFLEAYRHISPLVTLVKDGHTNIFYGKKYFDKKSKNVPFYLRKLDDKYFLGVNGSADSTILRGSELKEINGEPIAEILKKIDFSVSVDNDNQFSKMYYLTGSFPTYYSRTFGSIDSVSITYRLPDSANFQTRKVACLTDAEISKNIGKRYKSLQRPNLALKIVDSLNKIAILDITSFQMKGKFDPLHFKFNKVLKDRFSKIKQNEIEHLIIDFRGNGGGFVPNIARVVRMLHDKPFKIIETYGIKKSAYFTYAPIYTIVSPLFSWMFFPKHKDGFMLKKNLITYKPNKKLGYRGKTYFVIDPGCYSATTFTLSIAKDLGLGSEYIGQQVGGASWGSFAGNWKDFKLPNTKFTVHTPLIKITHKLEKPLESFFLQPTYEVGRNYEELRKNNSNSLDFTIKMIQRSLEMSRR